MPVHKHRRVEDMAEPGPAPDALAGLRSACELSRLSRELGPPQALPRGVLRFRSVAEADAERQAQEAAAVRRGTAGED